MLNFIKDDKMATMDQFSDWLRVRLSERNWLPTDLAREANLGNSTVTRILSGERGAGPDVCNSIARALDIPPEQVFRAAGLLPEKRADLSELGGEEAELVKLYRELPLSRKEAVLEIVKGLVERVKRRQ